MHVVYNQVQFLHQLFAYSCPGYESIRLEDRQQIEYDRRKKPSPMAAKCTLCTTKYNFYINFLRIAAQGTNRLEDRQLIEYDSFPGYCTRSNKPIIEYVIECVITADFVKMFSK